MTEIRTSGFAKNSLRFKNFSVSFKIFSLRNEAFVSEKQTFAAVPSGNKCCYQTE